MKKNKSAMRQIHLDFHTSEQITGVAGEFQAEEFVKTLKKAHVNSINLFARCHHGMLYYDSLKFPERVHPHLEERNLLKLQTQACRDAGIRVNLYTSVRWDVYTVKHHQEWVCIDENGALSDYEGKSYFEAGFYKNLCVNTGYRDFLKTHLLEFMEDIPADGIWFDASFVVECCCPVCMEKMRQQGLDGRKKEDRQRFAEETYQDFVRDLSDFIRQRHPEYDIFYNKGHVGKVDRPVCDSYTYLAMESLPGGPWDYLDFPHTQRYVRNWGLPTVGLTGKFHTSWGDFHSFREKAALEYECFHMLALGAGCNIGDQLEPCGKLSEPVYELIGEVYEQVEKKEPWCVDAAPLSEIGVLVPEEFYGAGTGDLPPASQGACRILQESGYQFEFVDSQMEFDAYRVLILPDVIPVDERLADKLRTYIGRGGKILASFESGLNPEKSGFAIPELGISYVGPAPYEPDYLVPGDNGLGIGLPKTDHVMYQRASQVEACGGEIMALTNRPMFNRTYEHFTSHMHAPSAKEPVYPAIVRGTSTLYFAHPIFTTLQKYRPKWCRQLIRNALEMFIPDPLIRHNGPGSLLVTVLEQADERRYVIHLLHYIPEKRSEYIETVEDVIPLYHLKISCRTEKRIRTVRLVPDKNDENDMLDFTVSGGYTTFVVEKLAGHQMIELSYT